MLSSEVMQDDAFPAAERILADIDSVFKKDPKLEEFDIVPVTENQNKSPVIHVNHSLGLESWCVRHMYCYIYHRLMNLRVRRKREDPATLIRLLHGALLINPDTSTFWNMSKELVMRERLTPEAELHFTAVVLTRKAKCAEALNQRKWVVNRVMTGQGIVMEDVLQRELAVAEAAAARYPNNYHAWNHRMWAVNLMAPKCCDEKSVLAQEWQSSSNWVASHVSDHSGMQYRQFLLQRIASLKVEQSIQTAEDWKQSMEYFISSNDTGPLSVSCWNHAECIGSKVGILSAELRFNSDLIIRFEGHESLWCHRRYMLTMLKKISEEYYQVSASTTLEHCTCNILARAIPFSIGRLERNLAQVCITCPTDNPHQARHAQQHLKWLVCVLKIELPEEG